MPNFREIPPDRKPSYPDPMKTYVPNPDCDIPMEIKISSKEDFDNFNKMINESIVGHLGGNQFVCANCEGIFERSRTEEDVWAEAIENFGEMPDDAVLICDECYKHIMAEARKRGLI